MATTYLNASKGSNITYDQFAFGVGHIDQMTLADSIVWHEQYTQESDPTAKREWLHEWQHNYLMGNLKVNAKEADRILSQTKDERTAEHQKAYKRANSRFAYHIKRDVKKAKKQKGAGGSVVMQQKVTVAQVLAMFKQLDKSGKTEFKKKIA